MTNKIKHILVDSMFIGGGCMVVYLLGRATFAEAANLLFFAVGVMILHDSFNT